MSGQGSGPWMVVIAPSPALPQVLDAQRALVASMHRERAQAAGDAILLAHAPEMLDALHHVRNVLEAMARYDPGPSGTLAADTHKRVDELLRGPLSVWTEAVSAKSSRSAVDGVQE